MNDSIHQPVSHPMTSPEKVSRLREVVGPEDTLAILINADPDAMASAIAFKRLFWRKIKKVLIYRVNSIQRTDNLAFVKLLRIKQYPVRSINPTHITKWAILDSQPHHHEAFMKVPVDIIIDHHPLDPSSKADYMDIREHYGANATILTEYLLAAKIRPSRRLATALFYGIKTDTDNFVRASILNDVSAFRYLYRYTNMHIVKKIESSEMTQKTLASYKIAMERLILFKNMAIVHMDEVENPDILVIIADFFLRLAETTWSIVSGINKGKLIIIFRNAGFRGDAGKTAQRLFGGWGASAGGHKDSARAEIPMAGLLKEMKSESDSGQFVLNILKTSK
ncbi:MAG: DHH family phosphoesterase [Deltaproteobacteria bacterium]|nr:DHH family phosphoesterase [Deltaproteobacteria bacterium]